MKKIVALLVLSFCIQWTASAQQGMWEAYKVTAGEHVMTPHAKWMHFKNDGSFTSGNGWLQNDHGRWVFDAKANTLHPQSAIMHDPAGPFKIVSLTENEMTWQRNEEGMEVTVYLRKIEEKPAANWDKIKGLWELNTVQKDGNELTNNYNTQQASTLFIGWDRQYRTMKRANGDQNGIWYMHPHSLVLTTIGNDNEREEWKVSLEENKMVWEGQSESNKGMTFRYDRIKNFPN